jgi:hypothetical protein
MCCDGSRHTGVQAPMRSRASGPGWRRGDTKVSGRRVTCKAPLAHLVGGSGRPETSPTASLQDTHSLLVGSSQTFATRFQLHCGVRDV